MISGQLETRSTGRVQIADTTLRDEELLTRNPSLRDDTLGKKWRAGPLSVTMRREIARRLGELGVDVIEAGFGDSAPEAEALEAVAGQFREGGPVVCGLVAAHAPPERIAATAEAVATARRSRVHLYARATDLVDEEGRDRRDPVLLMDQAMGGIQLALEIADEVEFSPPRLPVPEAKVGAEWAQEAVGYGATVVNVRSTPGSANPEGFLGLLDEYVQAVPPGEGATLSADPFVPDRRGTVALETATRCAEVGIEAGCRQVKCAIHGVAGTPGHPSLEVLAFQLWLRNHLMESTLRTGVDPTGLVPVAAAVARAKGVEVPPSQPLVGTDSIVPRRSEFPQDPVERALLATAKRIVLRGLGVTVPSWLDEFALRSEG